MGVVVSVPGKFHAFELATQLNNQSYLDRLYTSYPSFSIPRSISNQASTIPSAEGIQQISNHLPIGDSIQLAVKDFKHSYFDWRVARDLESSPSSKNIFQGYSAASRRSLERANELGYITVVERASAHPKRQRELLQEVYNDYKGGPTERAIARQEQEYKSADHIIVPSTFVKDTFIDAGIAREKVHVVPLGVNIDRFALEDPTEPFTFLFVGGNIIRKGVSTLIDAWKKTSFDGTDARLVIGGYFNDFPFEKPTGVEIAGYIEDLEAVYRDAGAFILPSFEDGFGMVVLEAMASGLPVIVSERTGAKDCVRSGIDGYVTSPTDSREVAEVMERTMNKNWDRSEICDQAHKFSWSRYGDKTIELYNSFLDNCSD